MMRMNKNKKGQAGFVITVELLLIVTVLVIGLVAGLTKMRDQTVAELNDTSDAVGAIDQSFSVRGTTWLTPAAIVGATVGFQFDDGVDTAVAGGRVGGDAQVIIYGTAPVAATETTASENTAF